MMKKFNFLALIRDFLLSAVFVNLLGSLLFTILFYGAHVIEKEAMKQTFWTFFVKYSPLVIVVVGLNIYRDRYKYFK